MRVSKLFQALSLMRPSLLSLSLSDIHGVWRAALGPALDDNPKSQIHLTNGMQRRAWNQIDPTTTALCTIGLRDCVILYYTSVDTHLDA